MKTIDIKGQKFGLLTAIEQRGSQKSSNGTSALWLCLCECGNQVVTTGVRLRTGNTKSCGCMKKKAGERNKTHGKSKSKAYQLWAAMVQRAKGNRSKSYVSLGIGVCERWMIFENFYADMGDPPPGYSLERVNNFGDYTPENCKWIPKTDQWRNRRNTKLIEFRGRLLSKREIEDEMGWTHGTIYRKTVMQNIPLDRVLYG